MGSVSYLDYMCDICRSFSDILHICAYLVLVTIASLIALYCFDRALFKSYVYLPFMKFCINFKFSQLERVSGAGRKWSVRQYFTSWEAGSNRLPYFVKSVKNFFNRFK